MKALRVDPDTALAIGGLTVLAAGLALVSVPLALIVVGTLVLVYAILPDRGGAK